MKLAGPPTSQALRLTTKELSKKTWPDFETLFTKGGGWDFCWCMHFHRARFLTGNKKLRTRAERSVINRREKRELVEEGRSHGIIVYANGEPVGWCQYGPEAELPRIDSSRHYQGLAPKGGAERLWRITCFVVDNKHRKRGVSGVALRAVLEAIRSEGGGLVEAYPISWWQPGNFGSVSHHGTVSMFKKEGFKIVAPFGGTKFQTNVLMRRRI